MEKISVEKAAMIYDGRCSCKDCPFYPRLCTEKVMNWCTARTRRAFVAGARWQKGNNQSKEDNESIYQ